MTSDYLAIIKLTTNYRIIRKLISYTEAQSKTYSRL